MTCPTTEIFLFKSNKGKSSDYVISSPLWTAQLSCSRPRIIYRIRILMDSRTVSCMWCLWSKGNFR